MLQVRGQQVPQTKLCNKGTKCTAIGIHSHKLNQEEKILWALETFDKVSNAEFVFDLRCTRFGGHLFNLREKGYVIETISGDEQGEFYYKLVARPDDTQLALL
tara:strand:- start:871 stop:1179 length:309 start_codon:yes stop_codon:yes gene_type:complete